MADGDTPRKYPPPVNGFDKRPQDINYGGRPKKEWTWGGLFREEMDKYLVRKDGTRIQVKEAMAKRIVKMVFDGDMQAFKEIANRMEGLPIQFTDYTSGGKPIPIMGSAATIEQDVQPDNSNNKDIQPDQENPGSERRDVSE